MQIRSVNNLNFKSEIYVLSPKDYERVTSEMEKNLEYKNIFQWKIGSKDSDHVQSRAYRTDSTLISTEDVRSCTLLHLVDKGKPAPLTVHALDSEENVRNFPRLKSYVKGSNAFIMGSKSEYDYSSMVFDTAEKMVKEENIPATIFRDLNRYWQSSMAYNSKFDRIFVCISEIINPLNFVGDMEALKRVFKQVKFSPTDTIEFFKADKTKLLQLLK